MYKTIKTQTIRHGHRPLLLGVLLFLMMGASWQALAAVVYVNHAATGDNNGTSWEHAYNDLHQALSSLAIGDEVWIAQGTYGTEVPSASCNRSRSFLVRDGITIYGGLTGMEKYPYDMSQRDLNVNKTIVSGDLNNNQQSDPSDARILMMLNAVTNAQTVIDGIAFEYGHQALVANNASYKMENCQFAHLSSTGGIVDNENAQASFVRCLFEHNKVEHVGAVLYANNSTQYLESCRFQYNHSQGFKSFCGSILLCHNSDNTFINSVFFSNTASSKYNLEDVTNGSLLQLINCSFDQNEVVAAHTDTMFFEVEIYNTLLPEKDVFEHLQKLCSSPFTITHSVVPPGHINGANQWDFTPAYQVPSLSLPTAGSAAHNLGDANLNPTTLDIGKNTRVQGGQIDLGAYEYCASCNFNKSEEEQVEPLVEATAITAFPNPAREAITLESDLPMNSVVVFDLQGNMLNQYHFTGETTRVQIDLSGYQSGMYLLRIQSPSGLEHKSVVVL